MVGVMVGMLVVAGADFADIVRHHSHSIVQVHHKLLELLDKIFILVWVAESRSVKFLTL